MQLTKNAVNILESRYLLKDTNNNLVETPEEMFCRVAKAVALADRIYDINADIRKTKEEFFTIMSNLEFLPNSPTLMNAGRPMGQLSACFVIPVGDSMEEIFDALKYAALIHKSGGGTGFSFSHIRPKGSLVKSTGGTASGPVSFMKLFNLATEVVRQGGKRRGANMGILKVNHPDILDFITCKNASGEFENFNISVGITEEFMQAVEKNCDYELINPDNNSVTAKFNACKIFDLIAETAWKSGEPGIIFLDRINNDNPTPWLGEIESTNPCGEQPLLPFESCNLGSINLSLMVEKTNNRYTINYNKLLKVIKVAVHFLDNVIDINDYPLQRIKEMTLKNRKIGLGIMGFADMLYLLGIPYNSNEAVQIAEQLMEFINRESKIASSELAAVRGSYPECRKTNMKKLRNATTTTIAPTGTLSIIAGTSSGIEPVYSLYYTRKAAGHELHEINNVFKKSIADKKFYSDELMEKISINGSIQSLYEIPEEIRKIYVTTYDIAPEWHIKIQAAFQRHIDNAVSKTVNLPNSASKEDVKEIFRLAYKLGLKGVTIYRDGSRSSQVLNIKKHEYNQFPIQDKDLCVDCSIENTF